MGKTIEQTPEQLELYHLNQVVNSYEPKDRSYGREDDVLSTSQCVVRADNDRETAKQKMAHFLASNAEYLRLLAQVKKTEAQYELVVAQDKKNRARDVHRVRNILRIKGLTADSRKSVAELSKKYS